MAQIGRIQDDLDTIEDDFYSDYMILADYYSDVVDTVESIRPQALTDNLKQVRYVSSIYDFPMQETQDDDVHTRQYFGGRGCPAYLQDEIRKPGGISSFNDGISSQIREVMGIGHSNEIIERSFRAIPVPEEKPASIPFVPSGRPSGVVASAAGPSNGSSFLPIQGADVKPSKQVTQPSRSTMAASRNKQKPLATASNIQSTNDHKKEEKPICIHSKLDFPPLESSQKSYK